MTAQALHYLVIAGRQQVGGYRPAVQAQLNLPVNAPRRVVAQNGNDIQPMPHRRVKLHPVKAKGPVSGQVKDPGIRIGHLRRQGRGQGGTQHPQAGHIRPALGHLGRQQSPPEVAEIAAVKGKKIIRAQQRLQGLVDKHSVHRRIRRGQALGPFGLGGPGGAQFLEPGQILPGMVRRFPGQLGQYAGHIADDAHGHAAIAPDFGGRRVNLDDFGIRGDIRRPAEPDRVILLAAQHNYQVGIAQLAGGPVQAALKEPESVGMIIRQQPPSLPFGQYRGAGGFGKGLQGLPIGGIAGGLPGDNHRPLRRPQQFHRLAD